MLILSMVCYGQADDWLFSKYFIQNQSSNENYISTGLQPNYLLKGYVGNKRIVIQVDTFQNRVAGDFFYNNDFESYYYHGQREGDSIVLNFEDEGVKTFYLIANEKNTWKGSLYYWNSKKAKRVTLSRYNLNKIKPNKYVDVKSTYLFDGFAYHTLRWKKLKYTNTGRSKYADKYVIQYKIEPRSNTHFFTIKEGYDSFTLAQLNRYLQHSIFDRYISNLSSNNSVVLSYLDSNYISYYIVKNRATEICKGQNYRSAEVFNVHTGIPLSLRELLRNEGYYNIVVSELLKMYPDEKNTIEAYCSRKDNFPLWYLTDKGIIILYSTEKLDCEYQEWFVPYQRLEQYFNIYLH